MSERNEFGIFTEIGYVDPASGVLQNEVYVTDERPRLFEIGQECGAGFTIRILGDTILEIDKDGMTYKGQRIEDAGEAHRAFTAWFASVTDPCHSPTT